MQNTCRLFFFVFSILCFSNTFAGNTSYIYDEFGRIKAIYYKNKQQHFSYDALGNRLGNTILISDLNDTIDTDSDGIPNNWESLHGFSPLFVGDGSEDADADGLSNLEEFLANTDPNNTDTDGDGIIDSLDPTPTINAAWLIPIFRLLFK